MGERRGTKGLELWCKKITEGYPGVKVENMTTSWRDGLAFCALIHHFRPELIDFSKLDKDDVYRNNELAFRVAEQYLGIPALLEAEDMVDYPVPDRLSILTYLSQFYQTFNHSDGSSLGAAKRTNAVPDRTSIVTSTATSSPPKKMCSKEGIHIGIPRREPCGKCGLPVFIAERLNVGKQLYHRTCFRCARCNSQLSLANYYETETDNQYCCETCPDEEIDSTINETASPIITRAISDEEKSNHLQADDDYSAHFETALESQTISEYNEARSEFLKEFIEDTKYYSPDEQKQDTIDENLNKNEDTMVHVDDEFKPIALPRTKFPKRQDLEIKPPDLSLNLEEDQPPELPITKCPSLSNLKIEVHSLELAAKSASLSNISASLVNESGFHSNPESLSHSVNKSVSDKELVKDNSITKENVHENSSLVKARMRLFQNNIPNSSDQTSKTGDNSLTNLETNDDILNNSNESIKQDNTNEISIISISDDSKISLEPIEAINDSIKCEVSIRSLSPENEDDPKKDYPDDLNPFGDDEENNYDEKLNPFGDDDDASENLNPFENNVNKIDTKTTLRKISVGADVRIISNNDDDTPEHLKKIVIKRTRLTQFERQGESCNNLLDKESPNKKLESYQKTFFGSTSSISSEATSTPSTRKKKPAPRPPIPNFSPSPQCSQTSSPSNSSHPSPRLRKNKKAPPPPVAKTPDNDLHKSVTSINEYNSEKQIKDEVNSKRKSQSNFDNDDQMYRSKVFNTSIPNKSTYGKWKRKKGQAPPRPIAQKRSIKPVSLVDIKGELDLIEIQQQGLEKQGVRLEKMIREQCEGPNSNPETAVSIEADDLILQLFEVVNEKNELFRRQAELMYIQRQHALEEEQAEVEYQIRCLMLQPEVNKTDSDKAKEEELINRLVNIVERRNEIVDCLERERVRDFEEDESISSSLNLYATKRDEACLLEKKEALGKKSKKFKIKTLYRKSKTDVDKDIDESELSKSKEKKHKKFNLFS